MSKLTVPFSTPTSISHTLQRLPCSALLAFTPNLFSGVPLSCYTGGGENMLSEVLSMIFPSVDHTYVLVYFAFGILSLAWPLSGVKTGKTSL